MIRPLIGNGMFLGLKFETERALFFFGGRQLRKEDLTVHFPQFNFCFLKQVHGVQVVHADPNEVLEADGHFTGRAEQALVSQTADCVPILLANDQQVCALHAGWRGVAGDIVSTSKLYFLSPPTVAVIGPHIQAESFEIGLDVMGKLLAATPAEMDRKQFVRPHANSDKCFFDLAKLVRVQLTRDFPDIQIFETGENTFTNPSFHSFRRDGSSAGRQYNFVVLKP